MVSLIPELHRRLPPEVLRKGLEVWNKHVFPSRCIRKYGRPSPDDVVLDVGAHKGEFLFPANYFAKDVYGVEPDPDNWLYITNSSMKYMQDFKDRDLKVYHFAISDTNDRGQFNIAEDRSESSIEMTDTHRHKTATKQFKRLDSLAFMDKITFLKIDSEGHEPEVLASLGQYRPRYIAVDVSPERDGQPTRQICHGLLADYNYEIEYDIRHDVLKAHHRPKLELQQCLGNSSKQPNFISTNHYS